MNMSCFTSSSNSNNGALYKIRYHYCTSNLFFPTTDHLCSSYQRLTFPNTCWTQTIMIVVALRSPICVRSVTTGNCLHHIGCKMKSTSGFRSFSFSPHLARMSRKSSLGQNNNSMKKIHPYQYLIPFYILTIVSSYPSQVKKTT